ncbi:hypothetical protein V502_02938 [Pseudogymnoascus sp. VKM F-4520 (FW-2644)]|nr:hypothetical protein V502_02938 [Pseudogymnoascus sp. VKM F-4520 (FW-2644)]
MVEQGKSKDTEEFIPITIPQPHQNRQAVAPPIPGYDSLVTGSSTSAQIKIVAAFGSKNWKEPNSDYPETSVMKGDWSFG